MAGQTINDRLLAAKHSLAGQGLAKSVCKATTEELLGPKKKHLDYLVHCTNEPNVSIPQMANLLMERSQNTSWIVVFKALITSHHIMCYGNERYTQYLASSNVSFQLSNFVDKSGVQSAVGARTGYDMSPFIRRYAKYLNEKALSYRAVAFDFCKVKRGKEEGTLRSMNTENLLKTLPILQSQLDALLEFDCTANDLTNGVVNMCFMLLFRDLIRLFACYNDGIINLLEKYFEMNKKQCREALDLYKKFLIRMDRVGEFLKVAENIGIDKGDIPDLTRAPNSLLDALESHLASLEGNTPTANGSQKSLKSGVSALTSTTEAFVSVEDSFKHTALAEEEAALRQYQANVTTPNAAATNPFLSDEPTITKQDPIIDLFGPDTTTTAPVTNQTHSNAIDDLLSLGGNPFGDAFPVSSAAPASTATSQSVVNGGFTAFDQNTPAVSSAANLNWTSNFTTSQPNAFPPSSQPTMFPSTAVPAFSNSIFQSAEPNLFNPLQTQSQQMAPQAAPQRPPQPSKILTGDLESSLTSLVENLTMDSGNRGQWSSPKNQAKTVGGWQQPMQPMGGMQQFHQTPGQGVMAQNQVQMINMQQGMQQPLMGSPKIANPQPPKQEVIFDPFGDL